jgi:hypothetical protein
MKTLTIAGISAVLALHSLAAYAGGGGESSDAGALILHIIGVTISRLLGTAF